ncbi:MAG: peptidase S41, partial [Oscillatoriales cyanobacterium RM1_1_9]|nr:peptidase S41 [Oscillatoriales cyanobacterium RM1_1_9]
GPVVGSPTPGAVVAGRPFLMPEGSLLYVAVGNVYVDQTVRLEGVGVTPNIVVPFPIEYAQGADPQKQRAIAQALSEIAQIGR